MKRDVGYIRVHVDCCDDHEAAVDALEALVDFIEPIYDDEESLHDLTNEGRAIIDRLRGDSDV